MKAEPAVRWMFRPLVARTLATHRPVPPVAYDCVKVIVVRDGSANFFSEFGERTVELGDVVVLGPNVLCGVSPDRYITSTAIYLDADYLVDQIAWQHVDVLRDRFDAEQFAATVYTEPAQITRLGSGRVGMLMPWLDELVNLSLDDRFVTDFFRMQALWFSIAHVLAPFIKISSVRTTSTQRATACLAGHWKSQMCCLRQEAREVADLLQADLARRWSVRDLATEVHLSKSQINRLFVQTFGKPPIAYLTMLRTERMAEMLRATEKSIAVIAREVGWADADFATKQFRRGVGLTPSRYREIDRGHTASPMA